MAELKDMYAVRKAVLDNQEKYGKRRSFDEATSYPSNKAQLQSFSSFTNAISSQSAKLFKRKGKIDPLQPLPNRITPECVGSDANLLSSPNDAKVQKLTRRRRRSSTAVFKRHHRHRRQRELSGSDGECRKVIRRKKRGRYYQNNGVNAPPRHVHCNDWREMVLLTENLFSRKSEGDLHNKSSPKTKSTTFPLKGTVDASSIRSLSAAAPSTVTGSQQHYAIPSKALEAERIARVRNFSGSSSIRNVWIEETFCRRECAAFIASSKDSNKCGCGRVRTAHTPSALSNYNPYDSNDRAFNYSEKWAISRHTLVLPTDSYGTVEFQGGPHPFKAQYLRLNFDSEPADIMSLFEHIWQIPPPKLIITVHGGITNFDLQPKLARVFRKGLLKAARTTGAWIFTTGINAGVVRHVAAALEGAISSSKTRSKIVTVGIAPWGLLRKREDLVGRDKVVMYHPHSFPPKGRFAVLNNRSSFFLLVDNGTVGRYGADIILRRRLESYIAEKQKIDSGLRSVPVVCVVLEGGTCTVRAVLDYVTRIPRVPVVVCDGSGRASDLIAFAHQYIQEDGNLPEGIRPQLLCLIEAVFSYDKINAQCLVLDILACVRQKHMITIFRLGENQKQDVDYAILTALLKGQNLSPAEQLSLALAWNRVDIARSDIFVMGQDWPKSALHNAMLEALIHNRVDFVRLLLENGVSMHDFLTIGRLEDLYNTDQGPPNTLYYIVRDVVKIRPGYRYKLVHIGMAVEKLMANGFRSHYTSSEFRHRYMSYRNKCKELLRRKHEMSIQRSNMGDDNLHSNEIFTPNLNLAIQPIPHNNSSLHVENDPHVLSAISGSRALSNHILWRSAYRRDNFVNPSVLMGPNVQQNKDTVINMEDELLYEMEEMRRDFKYPFSDLLIWAVLTKRHDMALCMWQHGEEAMAKALIACRLYKSLAKEAAEDYLEVEICDELKKYAEEFRLLSLELLDHCYKQDDAQTLQLLTYELVYWGYETCLSLSVIVNNKQFLAHPCCQILLADLWHGGLRIRSNSNLKVIMGLLCPPTIFLLEFKSREELMLQPQTAAEHEHDINYSSSSSSSDSSSSSSSSSSDSESENELSSNGGEKRHPLVTSGTALDVEVGVNNTRRGSSTSVQSLNLANLFHSKRKKHNRSHNANQISVTNGAPIKANETKQLGLCEIGQIQPAFRFVGGAMALSATNIIGAVSTPGASLSTNSIAQIAEKENIKSTPLILGNDAGSSNTFNESNKQTSSGIIDARTISPTQVNNVESVNKTFNSTSTRLAQPSFFVGADEDEDEKISKTSTSLNYKETPTPLVNQTYLNTIENMNQNSRPELKPKSTSDYFVKKSAIPLPKGIPLPTSIAFTRKRQIKFRRKVYEFFVAPITTFWAWTLSFVVFLAALTYVLLIRTPITPTFVEWYLLAYVITFGLETIRKFFMSEPKKFKEKVAYFFANYWNFITSVAIIGFLIGFGFRVYPPTRKNVGRVILAVDSVLWSLKLLDFLGVHSRFGPYITMAAKMVMNMSSMIVMLLISLLAFGLVRQSITFPDEDWNWLLVRNIFYKPYFMLYGEVYADEIDVCGDEAWDEHLEKHTPINNSHPGDACVPGHWIPPLLMTVFLLIGNILLISMLIAIFNNIFDQTIKISQQIWLFQRYRQVMEYEGTPFLPPPFTPVYHAFMLLKYLRWHRCCCFSKKSLFCVYRRFALSCCCCTSSSRSLAAQKSIERENGTRLPHHRADVHTTQSTQHNNKICKRAENSPALFDFSLKLFLSEDQVEKLHDFEEECMEDMARDKEIEKARSNEERIHRTAERTDLILTRVNDLTSKEAQIKGNVRELEARVEAMESKQVEMLECMRQITAALPSIVLSLQNLSTTPSPLFAQQQHYQQHIQSGMPPVVTQNLSPHSSQKQMLDTSDETVTGKQPSAASNFSATAVCEQDDNFAEDTKTASNYVDRNKVTADTIPSSEGSSQITIFYPLNQASSIGNATSIARTRSRTTTIGGNESSMVEAQSHNRLFGSLASLNLNTTPSSITNLQNRKNDSTRQRRRHDEYTSITDAIDIDKIVVTSSLYNVTSAASRSQGVADYEDGNPTILSSKRLTLVEQPERRKGIIRTKIPDEKVPQISEDFIVTEDDADAEEDEEDEEEIEMEEEDLDEDEAEYENEDEDDDNEDYEFRVFASSFGPKTLTQSMAVPLKKSGGSNFFAAEKKIAVHVAESAPTDLRHRKIATASSKGNESDLDNEFASEARNLELSHNSNYEGEVGSSIELQEFHKARGANASKH